MKQVEALNPLEGLDSEAEEKRKQLEEEFSYDGYKYVRGELFANLREPAITIRNGKSISLDINKRYYSCNEMKQALEKCV